MTTQVKTGVIADGAVTVPKISATGTPSNSTYLRGDGAWASIASAANFRSQLFTSSGTWTAPANCTWCRITVIGGGGGAFQNTTVARPGGAGGVSTGMANVVGGTAYTVTVGTGGTGTNTGTGATGGGSSSFGSFVTATGGTQATSSSDGANGTASPGAGYTELRRGNTDTNGSYYNSTAGVAAAGIFAGPPRTAAAASLSAAVFLPSSNNGAGTGGAAGTANSSNATGGVGGLVYIEWIE